MSLTIETEQVPLRVDEQGTVRVGNTRVTLDTVVGSYKDGSTAEDIVGAYPTLTLADVYLVIGYYLRRRTEVEEYLQEQERLADEACEKIKAQPGYGEFVERMKSRLAERKEGATKKWGATSEGYAPLPCYSGNPR